MDIQIGMGCKDQVLCDQIGLVFGYSFLALCIGFLVYLVISVIKSKK